MRTRAYFTSELFQFLRQLKRHNQREWFQANKQRYQEVVRDPCLRFMTDLVLPFRRVSPWMVVDARANGGSLFRIYRDIRFSGDKTPYKTHVGMQFSHGGAGEDVHSPGFYLHLEPENCFAAAGCWHPDPHSVARIRDAIAWKPDDWIKARRGLTLEGESLVRPPRGYSPNHPLVEDLKHTDFVAALEFKDRQVCSAGFRADFLRACQRLSPLVEFLSRALGLGY